MKVEAVFGCRGNVVSLDAEWSRDGMAEVQGLLLDSPDLTTFLGQLTKVAAAEMSRHGAAHCSITLFRDRRHSTAAFSDDSVVTLDETQYGSLEGPCLAALRTERVVETQDLQHDERWPKYRRAALDQGIRSVLAVPIVLGPGARAALNCYAEQAGAFDSEARASAEAYANLVSSSMLLAVRIATEAERATDLETALESRTAINLATGIIMAQMGCSQQKAVDILRQASNHRNVKLRDIAAQVLLRFNEIDPTTHFE